MQIKPVLTRKDQRDFTRVAKILYKNDPVWVCPLNQDIDAIFDPRVNTFFKHGVARRWVLRDDQAKLIGRIAAFIDYKTSKQQNQPTGGIGFFECIDRQEAANLLFDTAKDWLSGQQIEAMDGPINWGETDSYWGLLIEGFTHPSYEIAYNPPYYQTLFEQYGFHTYFKQEGFHLDVTKDMPDRFMKIAEWVAKKPEYHFRHFSWKDQDQLVKDFAHVYNIAWESFKTNFEPMDPAYIHRVLKKAKAIIEEEFIWLAYRNEEPIAIYLMYPDVNQIFKHLNGKLHLLNKIRFLWYKKKKTITRARGVLMGVVPKYQGLGIESAFIWNLIQVFKRKTHYREIEFSWVGDFNPKMRKIFISVGSVSAKHYITYRYLFDREKPFERFPIPE